MKTICVWVAVAVLATAVLAADPAPGGSTNGPTGGIQAAPAGTAAQQHTTEAAERVGRRDATTLHVHAPGEAGRRSNATTGTGPHHAHTRHAAHEAGGRKHPRRAQNGTLPEAAGRARAPLRTNNATKPLQESGPADVFNRATHHHHTRGMRKNGTAALTATASRQPRVPADNAATTAQPPSILSEADAAKKPQQQPTAVNKQPGSDNSQPQKAGERSLLQFGGSMSMAQAQAQAQSQSLGGMSQSQAQAQAQAMSMGGGGGSMSGAQAQAQAQSQSVGGGYGGGYGGGNRGGWGGYRGGWGGGYGHGGYRRHGWGRKLAGAPTEAQP